VNGTVTAPVDTERYFSRKVDSFYGELLIPLFSAANETTLLHRLDIDAAVRRDHYSDVGTTTNPKFGVSWAPFRTLTLRGSYGTSFRAPTISQIYGNTNTLFVQNYSDPTTGTIRQGVTRSGANLTLKPETATTYSFGADFKPTNRLSLSLTYFNIDYTNQVTAYLSDLSILQREGQFAGTNIIVRNPSAALIAQQLAETGFTGVLPSPVTLFVDGRNNNLGKTLADGLDFQGDYRLPTSAGTFAVGLNGTYFLNYKVAITENAPLLNNLNLIFNPLRFRARGSLGWRNGGFEVTGFLNYENGYTNNLSAPVQQVGSYKPVDLFVSYSVPDDRKVLGGLRLSVQVKNLFDEQPPFVNIAESANGGGGFDPALANPIGRIVSLIINKKF
jgi:iron complex outermembrane receptor protein